MAEKLRRGFQAVQGSVAPGTEGGVASRASKRLDPLGLALLAIPKKTREHMSGHTILAA